MSLSNAFNTLLHNLKPLLLSLLLIPSLTHAQDAPFSIGCQNITATSLLPRANATFTMLVRNSEVLSAWTSLRSVERHFNQFFHYPITFLNDENFTETFVETISAAWSGNVTFHVLPSETWRFQNSSTDVEYFRRSIAAQGNRGVYSLQTKAGLESYHHMCRFYSGNFFMLDVLKEFKYYWRLEPDIDLYCDVTYDPFVEMEKHGKEYGYAIAIEETAATCPTLFKTALEYKEQRGLPTTETWNRMLNSSSLPWPLQKLVGDGAGKIWNRCHYWSNFEIASLDFFRSKPYQDFYNYLDSKEGFYFERWGDAPVHSLAIAMFMDPEKVHYFEDIGYRHGWLEQCPGNAVGEQKLGLEALGQGNWTEEVEEGIGCRCECDGRTRRNFDGGCLERLNCR